MQQSKFQHGYLALTSVIFVFLFSIIGCDESEVDMLKGQVNLLKGEVSELESEKRALEGELATVGAELATVGAELATVGAELSAREGDLATLGDELAVLENCWDELDVAQANLAKARADLLELKDFDGRRSYLKITNKSPDWKICGVYIALSSHGRYSGNLIPGSGYGDVIYPGKSMVFNLNAPNKFNLKLRWCHLTIPRRVTETVKEISIKDGQVINVAYD